MSKTEERIKLFLETIEGIEAKIKEYHDFLKRTTYPSDMTRQEFEKIFKFNESIPLTETVNPFGELSLKDFYELSCFRGLGNTMWYDNLEVILKSITKLLKQKYPESDFRIKFLQKLIIRSETHEVDVEQEEVLRALLHYESYPIDHDFEDIKTLCGGDI